MAKTETTERIDGVLWLTLSDDDNTGFAVEGEKGAAMAERVDTDEVAIHFLLDGETQANSSWYGTRAQAVLFAHRLIEEALSDA